MAKKDGKLAQTLAEQFLRTIDPAAIADYLLSADVAVGLLADRIKKNPEATLRELQAMPVGGRGRARRPVAAVRPAAVKRGKRIRMTPGQIDKIKGDVRRFLQQKPWSNRKQISKAVAFPSLAAYNRILGELRAASIVQSRGEKSKTVYALKGAKAAPLGAKPAKGSKKVKAKKVKAKKVKAKKGTNPKKGTKPKKRAVAKKAKVAKKAAKKTARKTAKKAAPRKPAQPRLCPYPNCQNKAAPIFGMMCKEHKNVPKAERDKYFAARRSAAK
jgi:hypothetical protein